MGSWLDSGATSTTNGIRLDDAAAASNCMRRRRKGTSYRESRHDPMLSAFARLIRPRLQAVTFAVNFSVNIRK